MEQPSGRAVNAARNAAISGAAEVGAKVATLALTVVAARLLGPAGYGTFALALSIGLLLATVAQWGFDPLIMREGSVARAALPRLLGAVLTWRATLSAALVVIAAGIAAVTRPPDLAISVFVTVGVVADVALAQTLRAAAAVTERLAGVSAAMVAQRLLSAVLGIGGAVSAGVGGLAAGYALGNVAGLVLTWIAARRSGIEVERRGLDRTMMLGLVRRSLPLGLGRVASKGLGHIDQVLLGLLVGVAVVGTYAAVYRVVEAVLFVTWAVERVVTPIIASDATTERASRLVHQSLTGVMVLYVPLAVGIWLEAERLLGLLYGPVFAAEGTAVAHWLAVLPLLYAGSYLVGNTYVARARYWPLLWLSVGALVLNIALNLALIPQLAGVGAAIATVVAYGVRTVAMARYAQLSWSPRALGRDIAAPVAAAVAMAGALFVVDLPVVIEVMLGTGVYAVVWWPLATRLAPDQVAVLRAALRRA